MKYAKEILAIIVSAVGAFVTALGTGSTNTFSSIDTKHWLIAGIAILSSGALVALVSNLPQVAGEVAKAIVAFLSAGFSSLVIALNDNMITQAEWLTAFGAAVIATGFVYQATGTSRTP